MKSMITQYSDEYRLRNTLNFIIKEQNDNRLSSWSSLAEVKNATRHPLQLTLFSPRGRTASPLLLALTGSEDLSFVNTSVFWYFVGTYFTQITEDSSQREPISLSNFRNQTASRAAAVASTYSDFVVLSVSIFYR